MSETFLDVETHVAHMEKALDLTIRDEWHAAVVAHFETIAKAAKLVMTAPLDEEAELATVFEA